MDDRPFDEAARLCGAGHGGTRRQAVWVLAGGIGLLLGIGAEDGGARRRKNKHKKKGGFRCTPDAAICPPTTQRDCCNLQCCLAVGQPEGRVRLCTDWRNTCCTPEEGGGACPFEFPVCCPNGTCGATEEDCFAGVAGASLAVRVNQADRR